MVPPLLARPSAAGFWLAVILTGAGTGLGAAALTGLLELTQHLAWGGGGLDLLTAAAMAPAWRHIVALTLAGLLTAAGQYLLAHLTSANGIDITTAIWFQAGRLPKLRTVGSAVLSILIVGMGTALGREGAPKQTGAVIADAVADRVGMDDDQRRLLVACGAGAGMAAAYGVPVGGALFALEVLRGALALRYVLPSLLTAMVATGVSWIFLPDRPIYRFPAYHGTLSSAVWAVIAGPLLGLLAVAFVWAVGRADRGKPKGRWRLVAPILALSVLGAVSIPFPQVLGNGRDVAEQAFNGTVPSLMLAALMLLRPVATVMCLGSGAPGGLFTPTLCFGAMAGGLLGAAWSWIWPGTPPGVFALLGATAMLAASTQGPVSSVVLMMELTGYSRSAIVPMLLAVTTATLVARTIEPRSIYEARLTDALLRERLRERRGG